MGLSQNIYTLFFKDGIIPGIPVNVEYQIYLCNTFGEPIIHRYATLSEKIYKCPNDLLENVKSLNKLHHKDIFKINIIVESFDLKIGNINSVVVLNNH